MDKTSIIVVILGIISVTTGFAAEFTRVKVRISFVIAISLLLTGAKLNERRDVVVAKNGHYICYYIKPGVFAGGAVLAGLCCIFGLIYHRTLNSKGKDEQNQGQGGTAMAHPHFGNYAGA
ncbi:hypothetical protein GQ457_18G010050 [Hibiscus cannabinus]